MPTRSRRFAYLGPAGTVTELALRSLKESRDAELAACPTVTLALEEVRKGDAFGAVVPIENSVEGSVPVTLDELATGSPLMITREITVPVVFSLLARRGVTLEDVRSVATHPHAAAQTRKWVAANLPQVEVIHTASTAAAAAGLAEIDCAWHAAISAPLAAKPYDLDELAAGIGDNQEAITRFVLVTRPGQPTPRTGADKTSLVAFMHDDHPGALMEILQQFTIRGVNLTRIESRPTGAALVAVSRRCPRPGDRSARGLCSSPRSTSRFAPHADTSGLDRERLAGRNDERGHCGGEVGLHHVPVVLAFAGQRELGVGVVEVAGRA